MQFVFVFATAAACVASQAMISAAFSIIKQSIALGCFPQLTIHHVSKKVISSLYLLGAFCCCGGGSDWVLAEQYSPESLSALCQHPSLYAAVACMHVI